jgi:hypothetical protein
MMEQLLLEIIAVTAATGSAGVRFLEPSLWHVNGLTRRYGNAGPKPPLIP